MKASYKYIFIGNSAVGKSAIFKRYCLNQYNPNNPPTIGAAYDIRSLYLTDKDGVATDTTIHMWDTCGQERFRSLVKLHYRNANCALFVFDLTNRTSFNDITNWLNNVSEVSHGCIFYLVGNKSDLRDKIQVTTEEAEKFAQSHNMHYIETSAKTGDNITNLFVQSANQLVASGINIKKDIVTVAPSQYGCWC